MRLNARNLEKLQNYKVKDRDNNIDTVEQINIEFDDLQKIIQMNNDPLYASMLAKNQAIFFYS